MPSAAASMPSATATTVPSKTGRRQEQEHERQQQRKNHTSAFHKIGLTGESHT
jgi:hypothetical protein